MAVGPVGPAVIVVSGGTVSIVKVRLAGVGSTFPAASRARTSNVYVPSASAPTLCGDVHAVNAAAFSRHSNVAPTSEPNVNTGGPPASSVVFGAVVSIVNVRLAGVWSTFPAASRARTSNVYVPSASAPTSCGDVHAVNAAASSRHSNVAPASELNVNTGGPPASNVVCGAAVSTVNERVAGVSSTLPLASLARTDNVYSPSINGPTECGEVHGANAAVPSRQSNVEFGLVDVNVNDGDAVRRAGRTAEDHVSGVVVSTVNVRVAGVGSMFPAASTARTAKVYVPSTSGPRMRGVVHGANASRPSRHSNVPDRTPRT